CDLAFRAVHDFVNAGRDAGGEWILVVRQRMQAWADAFGEHAFRHLDGLVHVGAVLLAQLDALDPAVNVLEPLKTKRDQADCARALGDEREAFFAIGFRVHRVTSTASPLKTMSGLNVSPKSCRSSGRYRSCSTRLSASAALCASISTDAKT